MTFDINTIADICRPHNEKLIAEGRAARLERALRQIADMHLGDQPANDPCDERAWAMKHIAKMRAVAFTAISN